MKNLRYVLSIGLAAATLAVVLTYALGAQAKLQSPYAESGHNFFMSLMPQSSSDIIMSHMRGGQASATMQGMSESQMQGDIIANNILGSPAGLAAGGLAAVVVYSVIPLAAAAFVVSWKQKSFVVAGLLAASGMIIMILPLANMNFVFPGPIIGVVVGLVIFVHGMIKGIRTARAVTVTPFISSLPTCGCLRILLVSLMSQDVGDALFPQRLH
jgi:hypothetical protein